MTDYIERESVLSLAKDICIHTKWDSEYRHRSIDPCDVKEIPAADVAPVRHGQWQYEEKELHPNAVAFYHICSACGYRTNLFVIDSISAKPYHYCPNCGAKMDGEA